MPSMSCYNQLLDISSNTSQYIKQETSSIGENGKEARATRLITERASRRIGQMAFELARARPRKVWDLCVHVINMTDIVIIAPHNHSQVQRPFSH